jgi:hypothetical protein
MPTLAITRAGLAPAHAVATLDYLLSIMLWPVECDMRQHFLRAAAAHRRAAAAIAVPGIPADLGLYAELATIIPYWMLER